MNWVQSQLHYQSASFQGVTPEFRTVEGIVYLNSCAGLIRFKPGTPKELTRFRDDVLNRFFALTQRHKVGDRVTADMFALYRHARRTYRVSYKANLNTRLKAVAHAIGVH